MAYTVAIRAKTVSWQIECYAKIALQLNFSVTRSVGDASVGRPGLVFS